MVDLRTGCQHKGGGLLPTGEDTLHECAEDTPFPEREEGGNPTKVILLDVDG